MDDKELAQFDYFVSYAYQETKGNSGVSRTHVLRKKKMQGINDIIGIEHEIEKNAGMKSVVVLSWKQFEKEGI
jgi:hypothetical protein